MEDLIYVSGVGFSKHGYADHLRQSRRHMGINFRKDPRAYVNWSDKSIEGFDSYIKTGRCPFEFKWTTHHKPHWNGQSYVKESKWSAYISGDNKEDVIQHFEKHWAKELEGEPYQVIQREDLFECARDTICVEDFCGQCGGVTTTFWADWSISKKIVVFGGLWSDVPDMPSAKFPSDEKVAEWLEKHPSLQYEDHLGQKQIRRTLDFAERVGNFLK